MKCCVLQSGAPELMLPPPPPLPDLPPTASVYSAADLQRQPGTVNHVAIRR